MAWPMPPAGTWNAGMGMTPDMGMGGYSAEQWSALQQQNWQQWTQWQQQYAQWQSQYGEKYAEQIQAMQAMGGIPPLPPAHVAPPPAPPPPDKPPPPPPHENNQPLYGHTAKPPPPASNIVAPVPPPAPPANQWSTPNHTNQNSAGNNANWSYNKELGKMPPQASTNTQPQIKSQPPVNVPASGNAEALRKLTEEERLFDIQFRQWEQEIEKWRRENENHPDKQAYKEYEQKFETCRLQLMERRRQMKLKRDKLMCNTQQPIPTTNANNIPAPIPNISVKNVPNVQAQSYSKPMHNYPDNSNNSQLQHKQQYNMPQSSYIRSNNITIDPQDRHESYQNMNQQAYSQDSFNNEERSSFLPTSDPNKGIPGLDLVPDVDKGPNQVHEIVDISDDNNDVQTQQQQQQQHHQPPEAPDYSTISKGINNILGDEKIMNILSMVHNHTQPPPTNNNPNFNMSGGPYPGKIQDIPQQDNRNNSNLKNQQFGNSSQNVPQNRQAPNYMNQQNQNMNYPPPSMQMNANSQEQYYNKNDSYDNKNMRQQYNNAANRGGPPPQPVRSNMPPARPPLLDMPFQQNKDYSRPPERTPIQEVIPAMPVHPPQPKWVEETLFTPSIIVEYEHKPLRLKARDFIDPVHMFDYNHKSKDDDVKKKDFEKEVDDLFPSMRRRRPERSERDVENDRYRDPHPSDLYSRDTHSRDTHSRDTHSRDTYSRDPYSRDPYPRDIYHKESRVYDRRGSRENVRDDYRGRDNYRGRDDFRDGFRSRVPPRDDFEMNRTEDMIEDRGRDDHVRFTRRADYRERDREIERDRDRFREQDRDVLHDRDREWIDRSREFRFDDKILPLGSQDKDTRKRGHSRESEISAVSKKSKDNTEKVKDLTKPVPKHVVMIDDILELPGREMRPKKIVIILRGPPGSGKSYLAKLIRDREAEHGGTARVMSIDDYFMQEGEVEESDPATGKIVKKQTLKYEYDEASESIYLTSLIRAFKRSVTDGYFSFLIFDAVNDQLKSYADIWNFSRQNGFQVYICTMELDPQTCYRRNIHNRSLDDIQVICSRFFPTPVHHIQLDATTLLQSAAIQDVHMEDVEDEVVMVDSEEAEVESSFTSKWEKMEDATQLARLDGTSKPLRPSQLSMEDYLQLDDWKPNVAKPGKKTVRWADIEERREQEKMRAIGFVVGQTDWNRMTDPTMGSSALTQTKYIERVRRY